MSLTDPDYTDIIDVLHRYGIQMSRTVDPYFELDEESIRFTILNALNVIFKGIGSGETFNKEGKTDICIRVKDVNVFVAECKILNTPKSVIDGLDQLLYKYSTTYDSKVALILFNKKYDSSVALEHAKKKTEEFFNTNKIKYSNLPTEVSHLSYTLRYVADHPHDSKKQLTLTVVVINIQRSN